MDELKKYKLERKNKYCYCVGKGVLYLTSVYIISGISCLIENIPKEIILNIFSYETWITAIGVNIYSYINTLQETKK